MSELGTDLSCTDDLTETMAEVEGVVGVAQAIYRRLTTRAGGLLDEDDYGLSVRLFLHLPMTPAERASIPGQIRQEITKDPRIETVDVVVALITGETMNITINCTTAEGPFELVIDISAARPIVAGATVEGVLHTISELAEAES